MSSAHTKPVPAPATRKRGSRLPLFEPLETVLLRAPLLPLERYDGFSGDAPRDAYAALEDPCVRLALLVGSRSLYEALERDRADGRRDHGVRSKLLRYLIRMSSRPTPYGMFAGVCLAHLDWETDFTLDGSARRRSRPDMAWLTHLISTLESSPEVRDRLRVATNPAVYLRAECFVLSARASLSESGQACEVSIRATGGVRRALELAEVPVVYSCLRDQLLATPRATPDKVDRLLTSLLEQTFLLTELRPPLTGGDPARHVLDRLVGIAAARPIADELRLLLEEAKIRETLPTEEALGAYEKLLVRAERLVPREAVDTPFQVDLFFSPERTRIHRAVGEEACRAADAFSGSRPIPKARSGWRRTGRPSCRATVSTGRCRCSSSWTATWVSALTPRRGPLRTPVEPLPGASGCCWRLPCRRSGRCVPASTSTTPSCHASGPGRSTRTSPGLARFCQSSSPPDRHRPSTPGSSRSCSGRTWAQRRPAGSPAGLPEASGREGSACCAGLPPRRRPRRPTRSGRSWCISRSDPARRT